jgi:hypothetical protein
MVAEGAVEKQGKFAEIAGGRFELIGLTGWNPRISNLRAQECARHTLVMASP